MNQESGKPPDTLGATALKNKVQLIVYVDRFGGGGLQYLSRLLEVELRGLFGCVHLLPFFHPIDGADTGFDPIDHTRVDPRLGDWADIRSIASHTDVMADLIINHISAESPQFLNYLEKGEESEFADLFVSFDKVFPGGATSFEILSIYRPRPELPFSVKSLHNGSKRLLWTTFTPQQVDIDIESESGQQYLIGVMRTFAAAGVRVLRLDAVGYAIKRRGTSCFMLEDTFELINTLREYAHEFEMEILVEVHSHYSTQIKLAEHADWVYDFALPPLVLHTLFSRDARVLKNWLSMCPGNCISVLDTHDGIGVTDVAGDAEDATRTGLITSIELARLIDTIHLNSDGSSRNATGEGKSNLDAYQINCTYLDALGGIENDYLLARMIQFFSPGIPQVYYVGLLAGRNDLERFRVTGSGRDINRRYYDIDDTRRALNKPVVRKLLDLIRFRNSHPAFEGEFLLRECRDHELTIRRENLQHWTELRIDLKAKSFRLSCSWQGGKKTITDLTDLAQLGRDGAMAT